MDGASEWFLSAQERGNPLTAEGEGAEPSLAWTVGNHVEPLIHGALYFSRLVACLSGLDVPDEILIAEWRGDGDERLGPEGPRLGDLLCGLATRGVGVRGLLWRSHPKMFGFNKKEESDLAGLVNHAGGLLLLDERVRRGGSHHQKLMLLLHPNRPEDDLAFVGGIDLCHGRRDDESHGGDPQAERLDPAYGARPPWHDIQAEVHGPAIVDLVETFRERWNDPTPLTRRGFGPSRRKPRSTSNEPKAPGAIPPLGGVHPAAGRHAVQVLRTYPVKRPPYPFALKGERSIARMYSKVLQRARSFIYVEDQYFWSEEIATLYEAALRRAPELRLIVVVPRHPDRNGRISGPTNRLGQLTMMDRLAKAGGDRFAIYDLENEQGDAIYVHAKVVVIDDVLAMIGSDNMNRRSWTHDSELSIAVLDEELDGREPRDPAGLGDSARTFARDLRLRLWREHLGASSDDGLLDVRSGFERWREEADALDAWHVREERGPRPAGRVRQHRPRKVPTWQRAWAWPLYRTIVDPDGRPRSLQRSRRF
jgi:phosphatidylserine/phosphatidylglycerophosphate/cardiolipin synthase-like enzyme